MDFNLRVAEWYRSHKRPLPWRESKEPYKIWLSEVILQQTQIKQGLPYYLKFIKKYPSVFELAKASEDEILKNWQGLGYYSRARNLHTTAKHIVDKFDGIFPNSYKDLIKLKGVGDYTASAIASICFEESVAVLDGNVYRVLSRYFGIHTPINTGKGFREFKTLATKLLPLSQFGDYNQAVMDFGAKQCKPVSPDCRKCTLSEKCIALSDGFVKTLPIKIKNNKILKRYFNFIILKTINNRTILEKRLQKDIWKELYQFPLIETKVSITKKSLILNDDFKSRFGNKLKSIKLLNSKQIIQNLSHQKLHIKFWEIQIDKKLKNSIDWKQTKSYALPIVIAEFINNFSK
ncbi:MAG: A/G-specific adenine glycosylase [Flavobacteriaceae bacterium]|nr:A/G-specific adenine glycosylase [Flavobacteriaceae bacterium]|tara:strand:- start:5221 stop:6261 length:1041 start_codon:yes stop_codon:yes gene_type:complete